MHYGHITISPLSVYFNSYFILNGPAYPVVHWLNFILFWIAWCHWTSFYIPNLMHLINFFPHCLLLQKHTELLTEFFFFFFCINLFYFIYFWLCWDFVAVCRVFFSSCGEWGLLFVVVCRLLIVVPLLLQSTGSRSVGFSSCGLRALEHRLSSCGAGA